MQYVVMAHETRLSNGVFIYLEIVAAIGIIEPRRVLLLSSRIRAGLQVVGLVDPPRTADVARMNIGLLVCFCLTMGSSQSEGSGSLICVSREFATYVPDQDISPDWQGW
jgi:hypothetical protein